MESQDLRADLANGQPLVFISYSRSDMAFADSLVGALETRGARVRIDRRDLPLLVDWERELLEFIRAADTIVFIVSPASLASKVCRWEVDQVEAMGKRIAPVSLLPPTEFSHLSLPGPIARINAIFFDASVDFERQADALARALTTDVAWWKQQSRLLDAVLRWQQSSDAADARATDLLLRGVAIVEADDWAARRPQDAPLPSQSLLDFLSASRTHDSAQRVRMRRTIGRAFVKPADAALRDGAPERALKLAAAGALLADDLDFQVVPELWGPTLRAIVANRTVAILGGTESVGDRCLYAPDGAYLLTNSQDGPIRIWETRHWTEVARFQSREADSIPIAFRPDSARLATTTLADGKITIRKVGTWTETLCIQGSSSGTMSMDFDPSGARLVTASADGTIHLWNAETGQELAASTSKTHDVAAAIVSPTGRRLVTTSQTGHEAYLWSITDGLQEQHTLGHVSPVSFAAFSPDGRLIVSADEGYGWIWDAETGREIASLEGHTGIESACFNPDGTRVVTAASYRSACVWDPMTGELLLRLHRDARIACVAFSPDGSIILTASQDGIVCLWNAHSGRELARFRCSRGVSAAGFSPDGKHVATLARDGTMRIFDASLRLQIASLGAAAVTPDCRRILTLSGGARVLDVDTGRELSRLNGAFDNISDVSFSNDQQHMIALVTHKHNHHLCTWPVDGGQRQIAFEYLDPEEDRLGSTFWLSPDCRTMLVLHPDQDHTIDVWNIEQNKLVRALEGHTKSVTKLYFSFDGLKVLTASHDHTARLWDLASGGQEVVFEGHTGSVYDCRFSPDHRRMVSRSDDGTVRIWNAGDGTLLQTLCLTGGDPEQAFADAALETSGTRVVTREKYGPVRLWDTASGQEIGQVESQGRWDLAQATRSDLALLATEEDGNCVIRSLTEGEALLSLPVGSSTIDDVAFSPDGCRLVVSPKEEPHAIYDVSRLEPVGTRPSLLLAAAATHFLERRWKDEESDLLLSEAPADLADEIRARLGLAADDPILRDIASRLTAPLHPNCYLSDTQYARKFGTPVPLNDIETPSVSSGTAAQAARRNIEEADLATQEFSCLHKGIAIFRLKSGEHHVVHHFAVPTLDNARAAIDEIVAAYTPHPADSDL